MQQLLIPAHRARLLESGEFLASVCKRLDCRIEVRNDNEVVISGGPLEEYNARNVVQAFARGFDIDKAYKLLSDDYFFESIDMKDVFKKDEHIRRIKSRIIGREGKAKNYMQAVSGADLVIYGNTISIIGTIDEIKVVKVALNVLLKGGTHNKAYMVMEKAKKNIERK